MMGRVLRAALTETKNVYPLPSTREELLGLQGQLEVIRQANLQHHLELLELASRQGVEAICFGELFNAPYFALETSPLWRDLAEDAFSGPTAQALLPASARLKLLIVAPIYEKTSEGRFNTALVIEGGRPLGRFRKVHIPQGGNEQGQFHETFYYQASQDQPLFPVFNTSRCRLGIMTCYDRHFPYSCWSLAQAGAELVFCPSITFGAKSQRMWPLEFACDAARHRVFIGGSNRKGAEPPWNQAYFGESHFVGPDGLLENLSSIPELVIADLPLDSLSQPDPSGWNLPRDWRSEMELRQP